MSLRCVSVKVFGFIFLGLITACSRAQPITTSPTMPTPVQVPDLLTPPVLTRSTPTFEPYTLHLSDDGPYFIGKRGYDYVDSSRNDRQVRLSVWYPAIKPQDFTKSFLIEAEPDPTDAPYALILSSAKVAEIFAPHLVSHGFVVVGIRNIDTWDQWDTNLLAQPMDILFALDQVTSSPLDGMEGIIDVEHAGAMGYSFDGYNSLAMSGARVNPDFFLTQCKNPELIDAAIEDFSIRYQCLLLDSWEEFVSYAKPELTVSDDGLWQPMTDKRLLALIPMATEGWLLFGEEGLKAVDRPILIITSTKDLWYAENLKIFGHLGTSDRFLISFVGENHMMIYDQEQVDHMKHFAAAFFGYYLQGNEDYAFYFSKDYIDRYPALIWGG